MRRLTPRRGARQPAACSTGPAPRRHGPSSWARARCATSPSPSSCRLHRLDAVLRHLGDARPLPRDARPIHAGAPPHARCSPTPGAARARGRRSACCTRRRWSASGRPTRRPTTTSCCSPTSRGQPSSTACTPCASRWPSRTVGRTLPCRTSWRRWGRASRISSVPSRSPPAGGSTRRRRRFEEDGRRLFGDPADVARGPAGRGGRRVAARAGAPRAVGLRAGRGARQRRTDRRGVPGHPARARLSRRARPHREADDLPAARRRSAGGHAR